MASYENPWIFRSSFPDSWISEAFARDNETLTKALQKSLSNESETVTTDTDSSILQFVKPKLTQIPIPIPTPTSTTFSGSDPETGPKHRNILCSATGKIAKRKSRATKRSSTTFITADPANFRQMVQEVTGIQFCNSHVPVVPVLKPEPQRLGNRIQSCLPTLDTSAFLLDHHQQQQVFGTVRAAAPQAAHVSDAGTGFDFETFFPTLESWKVM